MPTLMLAIAMLLLTGSAAGAELDEADSMAWDLAVLSQALAGNAEHAVAFIETRHSGLLDKPIIITGELEYQPPDTLVRRILTPRPETFIIDDQHVTITRPRQKDRYLPLATAGALRGLATALRGILSGDLASLENTFAINLSGRADDWQLQLYPSEAELREEIIRLRIQGQQGRLSSFTLFEPDGDRAEVIVKAISDDAQ